jgi:hypothetical protein
MHTAMATREEMSRFEVRQDSAGLWFIGQPVKRRFLFWTWTAWVNVAFWPSSNKALTWLTREAAQFNLDHYRSL